MFVSPLAVLPQYRPLLLWLSLLHLVIITLSNYLVQIPLTLLGFHTTWGAFTFTLVFLTTDLTVRLFGAALARRIIFTVMIPALIISYLISTLFFQGAWQGLDSLNNVNPLVARVAIASFVAYLLGQLLDIKIFNRLRQLPVWWIAPSCSMLLGNVFDSLAFFSIAFYNSSDPFLAANWVEIALVDYFFKMLTCFVFFLPAYRLLLNAFQVQTVNSEKPR